MNRDDRDLLNDLLASPVSKHVARSKRRVNPSQLLKLHNLYNWIRALPRADVIALLSLIATVVGVFLAINWGAVYSYFQPPVLVSNKAFADCRGSVAIPEEINPQDLSKSEAQFFTSASSIDFSDTFFKLIGSNGGMLSAVLTNNDQNMREMLVENTIILGVIHNNMPNTINALAFGGGCGSGGPPLLLSYTGIPLSVERSFSNRVVELKGSDQKFVNLKSGEQVVFMFNFDCIDYGQYFVNIDVYYTLGEQRMSKRVIENEAVMCPKTINLWSKIDLRSDDITNSDTHYSLQPFTYKTVTLDNVYVYDKPEKDAQLIGTVLKGEDITILETEVNVNEYKWIRIRYEAGGFEGWVIFS